ncbi:MAG TPA: ubiquitin-like domain-containing protein, partial [Bacillota bacterium]|nr:ubiquitin-like domain-containing protein [Bacillota bacterium]
MVRYFTSSPKFFKVTAFVILMLMMTGTTILYLSNFKWATVYVNGETYRCVTLAESVEEVLEEIGLELREEDYV